MPTVRQWIERTAARFDDAGLHFGHGTDNSLDEAAWAVLHAIGAPLDGSFDGWSRAVGEADAQEIERLVEARIRRRCPLAYLTGSAWFAGLEFDVGPEVLVPRSPIAELIGGGFHPWLDAGSVGSVLDLCTGSGCIAIACALRFPRARVTGSDISEAALAVARRNAARHAVEERVSWVLSDVFDSIRPGKYDLIVSNPPYVPERELVDLPQEFLAEPAVGLVSAMDGLQLPLRIIEGAWRYLEPGGVLVCEVGDSQVRLETALPGVPFLWLEFDSGGSGVFLLEADQLEAASRAASELLSRNG